MAENEQAAAALPTCVLLVEAEIDNDVADAWNTWYDTVHLPEALACPGVLSGRRYRADGVVAVTDHGVRSRHSSQAYVTIYELTGPEAIETRAFQAMRGWYEFTDKITATTRVFNAC